MCTDFFDYYTSLFKYLQERKKRYLQFLETQGLPNKKGEIYEFVNSPDQYNEFTSFLLLETAILRRRRLKPKFGDFETLTQIGQGAFGEIHLVRHMLTKQICALKTIPKLHIQHKDQKLQILTERDILASTKYPHLVKLLYSFQDEKSLYLAMEYLPGGDFRTFLNSSMPLGLKEIKFYMLEMVYAVASVHELGYIHRDVKPENFLIDANGHLKLTDFGLACGNLSRRRVFSLQTQLTKNAEVFASSANYAQTSMTSDGENANQNSKMLICVQPLSAPPQINTASVWSEEVVGSIDYMAVEVVLCHLYNNSVDFWALGCILYEMFTGKTPFHANPNMILQYQAVLENRRMIFMRPSLDTQNSLSTSAVTENYDTDGSRDVVTVNPLKLNQVASEVTQSFVTVKSSSHQQNQIYPTAEEVVANGFIDNVSWDLINQLLTSPKHRCKTSSEILQHSFFMTMSPENKVEPPFIPTLDHDADCKYFDDFDSPEIQNMYVDILMHRKKVESRLAKDPNSKHRYQKKYLGFTFKQHQ